MRYSSWKLLQVVSAVLEKERLKGNDDIVLSSDSDEDPVVDKPSERQCSYCGDYERWNTDIFQCQKAGCHRKLCHKCKGIHRKHDRHKGNFHRLDNEI